MNYSNKKIISLLLSGAITLGVAVPSVNASYNRRKENKSYLSDVAYEKNIYDVSGMYTQMLDKMPVYVYLGNDVNNSLLEKSDALYEAELNYDKTYMYKKTGITYYYDSRNRKQEEKITVYAISDKPSVNGWTRIDKSEVRRNELVATSIELGEYLLKDVDLSEYYYNSDGFALVDLNKDGKATELVYLGNDKENKLFNKEDAIRYAVSEYNEYYILRKRIPYKNSYNKGYYVYAISDKSSVNGWTRVSKKDLNADVQIASNPEFMDALVNIYNSEVILVEEDKKEESNNNDNNTNDNNNTNTSQYSCMVKNEALTYAYKNYLDFCILSKKVNNTTIYAFSTEVDLTGWNIVGNDEISDNSVIFLSMNDAKNYIYDLSYSTSKKLTR